MIRLPPTSTRTDTLFPYTTLFRSDLSSIRAKKPPPTSRDGGYRPERDQHDDPISQGGPRAYLHPVPVISRRHASVERRLQKFPRVVQQNGEDKDIELGKIDESGNSPFFICAHLRSEERRGGNEWVSTCRSRWAPEQ